MDQYYLLMDIDLVLRGHCVHCQELPIYFWKSQNLLSDYIKHKINFHMFVNFYYECESLKRYVVH